MKYLKSMQYSLLLYSNAVFKCEWATVKDERLWVGGLGKEWTTTEGVVQHLNPQWVKSIGVHGDVLHHDWIENYQSLRRYGGYDRPGKVYNNHLLSKLRKRTTN